MRRSRQGHQEGPYDDPAKKEAREGLQALEDGRVEEDRIIGQEMVVPEPRGRAHARPEAQDRLREERSSEKVKRHAEQLEDEDPQLQGYRTPEGRPMRQSTSTRKDTPLTGEVYPKGRPTELCRPSLTPGNLIDLNDFRGQRHNCIPG